MTYSWSAPEPIQICSDKRRAKPTGVTLGSSDSDAFSYDANTGRMTQYNYTVNGSSVTGGLTWNANGSLKTLAITDPFNSTNNQTCNYAYDDLVRIASANCGTIWNETFAFSGGGQTTGALGNLTKTGISGATSFQPTYSASTNQMTALGGLTPTYDANGNLTYDTYHRYTWDAEGKTVNFDGTVGVTYDALGRMVEQNQHGTLRQIFYEPVGSKPTVMVGQTLAQTVLTLPGGGQATYYASGLTYYDHPDWLGGARLRTNPNRTVHSDTAYAPYGETYAPSGGWLNIFAGIENDTTSDLDDAIFRRYHPTPGRWISPDPGGLAAVDPANPQSWNRYAYAGNNPTTFVDPSGLFRSKAEADCTWNEDSNTLNCRKDPDLRRRGPTNAEVTGEGSGAGNGNGGRPGSGGSGTPTFPDKPFTLTIVTITDKCTPNGTEIDYALQTKTGSDPTGNYFISEHVSVANVARRGQIPNMSTSDTPNRFRDLLGGLWDALPSLRDMFAPPKPTIQFFSISLQRNPNSPGATVPVAGAPGGVNRIWAPPGTKALVNGKVCGPG